MRTATIMKTVKASLSSVLMVAMVFAGTANAMPLNSSARTVIPADLQQLISVDYRALRDSTSATALKQHLTEAQPNLEQFEGALKAVGLNPDKDIDSLVLATFRSAKQGVKMIGVAGGPFNMKAALKKMAAKKIKPTKYHNTNIYPMDGGFVMTFLDDSTLLFGEPSALHLALDARDGDILNVDSNQTMAEMMGSADSASFWSILDQQGTQNMIRSALGDASKVADFETVKKRIMGSHYTMDFSGGVNFDLTVVTSDSLSAATLSTAMKLVVMYKKTSASAVEKAAMDKLVVDSDGAKFNLHFKENDAEFQSLMRQPLFASLSK